MTFLKCLKTRKNFNTPQKPFIGSETVKNHYSPRFSTIGFSNIGNERIGNEK